MFSVQLASLASNIYFGVVSSLICI